MAEEIKVAGYVRVSTLGQKEKDTPEIQSDQIKKYCAFHDLHLFKIYQDTISGTKDDRPALNELFKDAEIGKFKRVIFTKLDRFGRSLKFILECYDKLEGMGITAVSISEAIDTSTPVGKLFRNILATLAEFEASRIAERMIEGRYWKTTQKQSIPGRKPYGYHWKKKNGKAILDEDEVVLLRKIFSYYLDNHLSIRYLVERINQEGHRTRHNKYWQASSVTRILKNPVYTGQGVYFKEHDKPIILEFPPIITPARHKRVLQIMEDKNTRIELDPPNLRENDPFLLRGLLLCGQCKSKMLSLYDGSSWVRRYICHWSKRKKWTDLAFRHKKCDLPPIDAEKLEKSVLNRIKFMLIHPSMLLKQLQREVKDTSKLEKEITTLQTRITKLQEGSEHLYDLYAEKEIDKGELISKLEKRKVQMSRLEEQKVELDKQFNAIKAKSIEIKEVKNLEKLSYERVSVVLKSMTNEQKKEFLRTCIDGRLTVVNPIKISGAPVQGVFDYSEAYDWLAKFTNTNLREYG